MAEPLGRSQVLSYLFRLTDEFQITLVSFEKDAADESVLRAELERAGISWVPLAYHRRPPVLSTLLDVLAGRRAVRRLPNTYRVAHVRSYVPALIALVSGRARWTSLLFDIRGFWADERVEGGIWPAGGLLYRIAKRCERWFFAQADAVVTLTRASVPEIRSLVGGRPIPVEVIPTCVDLERFRPGEPAQDGPTLVWVGSIGTWYRFDMVPALARAMGLPLKVVTRQTDLAEQVLAGRSATIVSRRPEDVPGELHAGDIGLCLIKSSFSKVASAPTRFAEYLAAGMPVVVTRGVGDLESLVEEGGVGVALDGGDDRSLAVAAGQVKRMAQDPGVQARCREVARRHFDVDLGSRQYARLYDRLLGAQSDPELTGRSVG